MPWRHARGTGPAGGFVPVELAQTGPREFTLRADLVHESRRHGSLHVVPAGFATDLASVPYPLWALIGPFGRHTRAAILHDHGVRSLEPPLRSPARLIERAAIDLRFRDALLDSDVPRLRAYLMWAGTSLDRVVRHAHPLVAAALVAQLALGLVLLVLGVRTGGWTGAALALVPLGAAWLWGRERTAVALLQYVGALVLPVVVLNTVVAALLALAGLVVGGRAPGIAPTSLRDDGSPEGRTPG